MARRYYPDSLIALVETVRLRQPAYAAARVAAAKELNRIGFNDFKDDGEAEGDALHLHLLAVNGQAALPDPTPPATPMEPEDAAEDGYVVIDMDLLPEPTEDIPGAALPLWDAYRARARAEAAAKDAKPDEPPTDDDETEDDL